jgi:TolB protein
MNADGTAVHELTPNASWTTRYRVDWSPNGASIAYRQWSSVESNYDIWVISAGGGSAENLTKSPHVSEVDNLWSPAGTQILSTCYPVSRRPRADICLTNTDGTGQRNLTDNQSVDDVDPSWSPDGSRIVFSSDRDGDSEIYVMDTDGTNLTQLTNNFEDDYRPAWSPDGLSIAFVSSRAGGRDIYVMAADGTGQLNVTNTASWLEVSVDWSPDSTMLAIEGYLDEVPDVFIVHADGSNARRMNTGWRIELPSWRP